MIAVCGIGTDAIDLEAARRQGIVVSNIPGQTAPIVAEHALALMLAIARRAWYQTHELKQGRWSRMDNVFLRGKTLGIVGLGSIGEAMARLGQALGMKVLAWTFHPTAERAAGLGVQLVSFEELLRGCRRGQPARQADGADARPDRRREIGWMKPGALLINTARGAIVQTDALVEALHSGHLGGAGIDVFDVEPLPDDHPLLACEQVVLTPHNADQTPEGMELLNGTTVNNVIAWYEGRPQHRVV